MIMHTAIRPSLCYSIAANFDQYGRPMVANPVQPNYYRPPQPHGMYSLQQFGIIE